MKEDLSFSQFYKDVDDAYFFISETCVDVSKCHISAEDGIRKIRGLLKPLDRYLLSTSSFAPIADLSKYSDKLWKAAYERGRAEALSEIIRCEDCKYYETAWLKKDGMDDNRYKPSICTNGKYGIIRKPDWFCADAKRREDETD